MKQEDKDLLLKDLCARIPYGVKAKERICIKPLMCRDTIINGKYIDLLLSECELDIKPYLFPMSSMTEEQKREYKQTYSIIESWDADGDWYEEGSPTIETLDWLNEHHFDFRNLIKRELAIDCTNLNIY